MAGLKALFELMKPDDVDARLGVVMTIADWRRLAEQLRSLDVNHNGWPASHLLNAIRELIQKADETLFVEHEVK